MTTSLDTVDTSGGIAVPNFFNGRILSAEDLRLVLTADRRHRSLLGRALGPGVAAGLRVTKPTAGGPGLVRVSAGVAVNRKGETIDLPTGIDVRVAGTGAVASVATASGPVFADCGGTSPTSTTSNAFLLTIRPDSLETGSAPADPYLTGQSCGPGFVAEGVRFRRFPVDPAFIASSLGVSGTASLGTASPRSRNVVAHLFLGSTPWSGFGDVATAGQVEPDLELAHSLAGLQSCEVPLALFYLQGGSVVQLDEWAVRRPCRAATDDAVGLGSFTSELRSGAGVATYLQFQAQLADLLADGTAPGPRAGTHLRYLPAAGILPAPCIANPTTLAAFLGGTTLPFFTDLSPTSWTRAERPIRSARVESVVRDGTRLPPVDVLTTRGLPVTVLAVHESLAAGEPYAVFVAGQHPYQERIDLDEVIDRLAAVEPPADEELLLTVVKQDHETLFKEDGYRIVARYRVVTNEAGRYQINPTASKLETVQARVDSFLHGDSDRSLPEGVTIITVDYTISIGGIVEHEFELEVRRDDSEEVFGLAFDRSRERERAAAVEDVRSGRILGGQGRTEGGSGGVFHVRVPYTFGIEVASVRDPEVVARASFGFIRP